jgi:hypothetical protein
LSNKSKFLFLFYYKLLLINIIKIDLENDSFASFKLLSDSNVPLKKKFEQFKKETAGEILNSQTLR